MLNQPIEGPDTCKAFDDVFCQMRAWGAGIKSQNSQTALSKTMSEETRGECLFISVTRRKLGSLGQGYEMQIK